MKYLIPLVLSVVLILLIVFIAKRSGDDSTIVSADVVVNKDHEAKRKYLDSLQNSNYYDSIKSRQSLLDTFGVYKAPVKVMTSKLFREEYATLKSIRLTWKNVSTKRISAIRFKWYLLNSFNEPADIAGNLNNGLDGGFADRPLTPNRTDAGTWSGTSQDASKIVCAWPYEVAFADGTVWKQTNPQ